MLTTVQIEAYGTAKTKSKAIMTVLTKLADEDGISNLPEFEIIADRDKWLAGAYNNKTLPEDVQLAATTEANRTFSAQMPEWSGNFGEENLDDFCACYGYTEHKPLFEKFSKHLRDTKRADHHRVSTGGPTKKQLVALNAASDAEILAMKAEIAKLKAAQD